MKEKLILFTLHLLIASALGQNFLIILTDDQDLLLKSLTPLKKIDNQLTRQGVIFSNAVGYFNGFYNYLINIFQVHLITPLLSKPSESTDGTLCSQHRR